MPFWLLTILSIAGAGGILVGTFVAINVISSVVSAGEKQIADVLHDVGTSEFDQPIANTATKRFTPKPKPALESKAADPAAAKEVAGAPAEGGGHGAAAPAEGGAKGGNDANLTTIKKVWIEEGCIVCDACVDACPDVFVIEGETCVIVPSPALGQVDEIKEAAEGCPVDVIRYS